MKHQEFLVRHRLSFRRSVLGPKMLHFRAAPGAVVAAPGLLVEAECQAPPCGQQAVHWTTGRLQIAALWKMKLLK